jgi:tellurite resistance protein TerC
METGLWCWFALGALIVLLLSVDLFAHRGHREPTLGNALIATGAWLGISIVFGVVMGVFGSWESAGEYFGVYLSEKSLSVDNIFVFAVLFQAFAVPAAYQRRVLFYGVIGALLFRAVFIAVGASLVEHFDWVWYILGVLLLLSGARMLRGNDLVDPDRNVAIRLIHRVLSVTPTYVGKKFVTRVNGRILATPLLIALLAIEVTDLVFAMDSIPAAFGISKDVFVIFAASAFAVLGLRSLYFVLAGAMKHFSYLNVGLAALLVFIGAKMLLAPFLSVPILASLAVIAVIMGAAIAGSIWHERHAAPVTTREDELIEAGR